MPRGCYTTNPLAWVIHGAAVRWELWQGDLPSLGVPQALPAKPGSKSQLQHVLSVASYDRQDRQGILLPPFSRYCPSPSSLHMLPLRTIPVLPALRYFPNIFHISNVLSLGFVHLSSPSFLPSFVSFVSFLPLSPSSPSFPPSLGASEALRPSLNLPGRLSALPGFSGCCHRGFLGLFLTCLTETAH